MGKEALEKMARTVGEYAYNRPWEELLPEHRAVACQVISRILEDFKELGYHKLPKEKPSLLSDEGILQAIWKSEYSAIPWKEFKKGGKLKLYERAIAQAQWDIWNKAIYGDINER